MIPVIQFDPASLSLWYDAHIIAKCRGAEDLRIAIEYAYEGNDDALRAHVINIEDPRVRIRAGHLASCIWHEKRHFLDFLITNYGALRIRQFFEVYRNLPALYNQSGESKRMLFPLDSNLDPLKREIFGIGELDPGILQFAEGIERRKMMLAEDRRSIPFPGGDGYVELGGEAILEAIAYHLQMGKAHRVFGFDIAKGIQKDQPPGEFIGNKYKWAHELLVRSGLLEVTALGGDMMLIHEEPFIPLLYAALASRLWKQEQVFTETVSSYLPGQRLSSLVFAILQRSRDFKKLDTLGAWETVNTVAKEIFGRSVLEETEEDIELEEKYLQMLSGHREVDETSSPMVAYAEYHGLRLRMFKLLKDDPLSVLRQPQFSDSLVNRLRPKVVVAASAGEIGMPPEGFERLFGYQHENVDYDQVPEARWWWAAIRKPPRVPRKEVIELGQHLSWCKVISDYAPLAKLAVAGLRCRIMLGPELISIKMRVESMLGVKLIIDGMYAPELLANNIEQWYFLTGHDSLRCEMSFDPIDKPDGLMLDPWELRLRPKLHDAIVSSMEGAKQYIYLALWRDWSPWILGQRANMLLEQYPRDPRMLAMHLGQEFN